MNINYTEYHRLVVEACVELTNENCRIFWDTQHNFEDEYLEKIEPSEVAKNKIDTL